MAARTPHTQKIFVAVNVAPKWYATQCAPVCAAAAAAAIVHAYARETPLLAGTGQGRVRFPVTISAHARADDEHIVGGSVTQTPDEEDGEAESHLPGISGVGGLRPPVECRQELVTAIPGVSHLGIALPVGSSAMQMEGCAMPSAVYCTPRSRRHLAMHMPLALTLQKRRGVRRGVMHDSELLQLVRAISQRIVVRSHTGAPLTEDDAAPVARVVDGQFNVKQAAFAEANRVFAELIPAGVGERSPHMREAHTRAADVICASAAATLRRQIWLRHIVDPSGELVRRVLWLVRAVVCAPAHALWLARHACAPLEMLVLAHPLLRDHDGLWTWIEAMWRVADADEDALRMCIRDYVVPSAPAGVPVYPSVLAMVRSAVEMREAMCARAALYVGSVAGGANKLRRTVALMHMWTQLRWRYGMGFRARIRMKTATARAADAMQSPSAARTADWMHPSTLRAVAGVDALVVLVGMVRRAVRSHALDGHPVASMWRGDSPALRDEATVHALATSAAVVCVEHCARPEHMYMVHADSARNAEALRDVLRSLGALVRTQLVHTVGVCGVPVCAPAPELTLASVLGDDDDDDDDDDDASTLPPPPLVIPATPGCAHLLVAVYGQTRALRGTGFSRAARADAVLHAAVGAPSAPASGVLDTALGVAELSPPAHSILHAITGTRVEAARYAEGAPSADECLAHDEIADAVAVHAATARADACIVLAGAHLAPCALLVDMLCAIVRGIEEGDADTRARVLIAGDPACVMVRAPGACTVAETGAFAALWRTARYTRHGRTAPSGRAEQSRALALQTQYVSTFARTAQLGAPRADAARVCPADAVRGAAAHDVLLNGTPCTSIAALGHMQRAHTEPTADVPLGVLRASAVRIEDFETFVRTTWPRARARTLQRSRGKVKGAYAGEPVVGHLVISCSAHVQSARRIVATYNTTHPGERMPMPWPISKGVHTGSVCACGRRAPGRIGVLTYVGLSMHPPCGVHARTGIRVLPADVHGANVFASLATHIPNSGMLRGEAEWGAQRTDSCTALRTRETFVIRHTAVLGTGGEGAGMGVYGAEVVPAARWLPRVAYVPDTVALVLPLDSGSPTAIGVLTRDLIAYAFALAPATLVFVTPVTMDVPHAERAIGAALARRHDVCSELDLFMGSAL